MDLNFFSGMDRDVFERGLRPLKKGYIPQKNDLVISLYSKHSKNRFHIFTNFEDGTTTEGWGIFYDIYDVQFKKTSGKYVLTGYIPFTDTKFRDITRRVEAHSYQFPNTYENWIWNYAETEPYIWKQTSLYMNWNENPFGVK
tara:strand:- start:902 stop:1327 length:426 start_codon:yes stop_codon:yes gene_type:complete